MGDWRRRFASDGSGLLVHPDARAGGGGPGYARPPGPRGQDPLIGIPDPDSRAASFFTWSFELPFIDEIERVACVYRAIQRAEKHTPAAILEATGQELYAIVSGLIPGLLLCLGVVAATTTLGAAIGAAIGALAGGVGAIPGAAAGAGVGLDVGVAALNFLGVAFLVAYIGEALVLAAQTACDAVQIAWGAPDHPDTEDLEVERAARTFADAVGLIMRGLLQGIVAFLLAKGTAAVAARVGELVTKLRASKLGAGFARWVELNWQRLVNEPKLQPPKSKTQPGETSTTGGAGGSQGTKPAPKVEPEVPSQKTEPAPKVEPEVPSQKTEPAPPPAPKPPQIATQKQAGHIRGTPQYKNRIKQGKPTSAFRDAAEAEAFTQEAWAKGTPVPGRPGVKDYDFAPTEVGTGPGGGAQTKVRVHMDKAGRIHGHPAGPELPAP